MRLQTALGLARVKSTSAKEERQCEDQVGLRKIAGPPPVPALHRSVVDCFEVKARVREEDPEAEINGGEVGEELILVGVSGRRRLGTCQEVMCEFMRQCCDELVRSPQEVGRVDDLNPVFIKPEHAGGTRLRRDHRDGHCLRCGRRIVVRHEFRRPVRHAARGLHLIENSQGKRVTRLAVGDEEARLRQDEPRLLLLVEGADQPSQILR